MIFGREVVVVCYKNQKPCVIMWLCKADMSLCENGVSLISFNFNLMIVHALSSFLSFNVP